MKIVYIAHPVGGDVNGNIEKIKQIVRTVNLTEPDTVPFVPYLSDLLALDDSNPEERKRGMKNNEEHFTRGNFNELRLYGDRISSGMRNEIFLARTYGIRIVPMTDITKKQYLEILSEIS